jgi:hypothetical protein
VTGGWRKLNNAELITIIIIIIIKSRKMRSTRYVAHGEMRNAYRILVGKPKEKTPLGRIRRMWEDNIKKCKGNSLGRCGLDSCG